MSWELMLWTGVGAFFGGILRGIMGDLFNKSAEEYPHGTFWANILGSFLIGIVASLAAGPTKGLLGENWNLFWAMGFCGSLTTFSTFSLETLRLFHRDKFILVIAYWLLSLILCVVAVAIGMRLGAWFL